MFTETVIHRVDQPTSLNASTDDEVLAAQAASSRAAFAELYRRHVDHIYRYCLGRTGSVQEAQELTADTFVSALECIRMYQSGHFVGWLFGIARNKVAMFYRQRRESVSLGEHEVDTQPHAQVETVVGERLQLESVIRILHKLSPDRAEALRLRILGDVPIAEIAHLMGKSEAAVRMLISRALDDIRGRLEYTGETSR